MPGSAERRPHSRQASSALLALLLLVTAVPAHADDPSTLADRLAQVQQEQARQAQRLNALQAQQARSGKHWPVCKHC